MNRKNLQLSALVSLFLVFAAGTVCGQRNLNQAETIFDFIQMKRSFARQFWSKENPAKKELEAAITALKEILVYLDKEEIRPLQEISVNLKSQRADVRYELSKALTKAQKKEEALQTLSRMADEAGSGIYADWMQTEPDKTLFAALVPEVEFQETIDRLRSLGKLHKSPALQTLYQTDITTDEKIAGLSLFWSKAKYGFVYFDRVSALDWDKTYLDYLPAARRTENTYEYYRLLQRLCALLRDGHTNVYLPKELRAEMAARPLLATDLVEDKVVVTDISSDALRQKGARIGQEIIAIEGVSTREYAEKFVRPYQSASTEQHLNIKTYADALLEGSRRQPVELTLRYENGKISKLTARRENYTEDRGARRLPFEFKILASNIGYVALNSFDDDRAARDFAANFEAISKTAALIIDLRHNEGGNSDYGDFIFSHLTDQPFQTARSDSRQYRALNQVYGIDSEWLGENAATVEPHKTKLYAKPIIVLVGNRTFSAAEDFALAFDYMKRGLLVGEPTGGSTGQPLYFNLPVGGAARICVKRDAYPDGRRIVGIGIKPNITVKKTLNDLMRGRDAVLETALKELETMLR